MDWFLYDNGFRLERVNCFCELASDTLLLFKKIGGWSSLLIFLVNITS